MKRFILALILVVSSGVIGQGQAFPFTKTLAWDANPDTDMVLHYNVYLDNVLIGVPAGLTQQITVTTPGNHIVEVSATNIWTTGPRTALNINPSAPGAPSNLRFIP